jgi:hypothetical protein
MTIENGTAMKRKQLKTTSIIAVLLLLVFLNAVGSAGDPPTYKKLAQTGMKFLNVGASAKLSALGEAATATDQASTSMFYNPAGMAHIGGFGDLAFGQTNWIADINHMFATVAISPEGGDYGVIGFHAQFVDYGKIQTTIRASNNLGYIETGDMTPSAYVVGVTYARALTDKFSVGGTVKYVNQNLGEGIIEATFFKDVTKSDSAYTATQTITNSLGVMAYDLGILYRTGFKSLNFGMTIRNFSPDVTFIRESFQLPLTFRIGLSMNVLDMWEMDPDEQSLLIAVDAEHPRDYNELIRVGAEYTLMKMFALRLGYAGPLDEQSLSYGFGFQPAFEGTKLGLDYSYTPFGVFGGVHRFAFRFGF